MPDDPYSAYHVTKSAAGEVAAAVRATRLDELPLGNILVRVAYSSLNYKDALAATGHPGVVRKFPHVPGIDATGVIEESQSPNLPVGTPVVVTSYDLGAGEWGAWSEYIRVPAEWVVPLPPGLSPRESMILGTAGLTAAMSLDRLLSHGVCPEQGEIVVTGATGGVGSWGVALLHQAGFRVAAVSGKPAASDYLKQLGATTILSRADVDDRTNAPLLKGRWAGAIDAVGGNILATILRATKNGGCVTACGLTAGLELPLTVHPFILRGVTLCGIDSGTYPLGERRTLWNKLTNEWRTPHFDTIVTREIGLSEMDASVRDILAGQITGRVIVKL